jgi:hypothetical protein
MTMGQEVSRPRSGSGSETPRRFSDGAPSDRKADRDPLIPDLRGKIDFDSSESETARSSLAQTTGAIPEHRSLSRSSRSASEDRSFVPLDPGEVSPSRPRSPKERRSPSTDNVARPGSTRRGKVGSGKRLLNVFNDFSIEKPGDYKIELLKEDEASGLVALMPELYERAIRHAGSEAKARCKGRKLITIKIRSESSKTSLPKKLGTMLQRSREAPTLRAPITNDTLWPLHDVLHHLQDFGFEQVDILDALKCDSFAELVARGGPGTLWKNYEEHLPLTQSAVVELCERGHFQLAAFLLDRLSEVANKHGKLAEVADQLWANGDFALIHLARRLEEQASPLLQLPPPPYQDFQAFSDLLCMVLCKEDKPFLAGRICLSGLNRGARKLSEVDVAVMDALAALWSNDKREEDRQKLALTGDHNRISLPTQDWLKRFDRRRKDLSGTRPPADI